MKKLLFTAICAMAFTNGFVLNDVKEVFTFESDTPCFDQYLKDKTALKAVGF